MQGWENIIWCLFKWGKLRVYKYVGVNLAVRYNFSMYSLNQMQDELLQATKQLSTPLIHDSLFLLFYTVCRVYIHTFIGMAQVSLFGSAIQGHLGE